LENEGTRGACNGLRLLWLLVKHPAFLVVPFLVIYRLFSVWFSEKNERGLERKCFQMLNKGSHC